MGRWRAGGTLAVGASLGLPRGWRDIEGLAGHWREGRPLRHGKHEILGHGFLGDGIRSTGRWRYGVEAMERQPGFKH